MKYTFLFRAIATLVALLPFAGASAAANIDDLITQSWLKVESANFRVVTEQPEPVARLMLSDLERLRYISSRVRGAEAMPGPPLTVVAMGKRNFRRLGLPESWGGVFHMSRMGYAALAGVEGYAPDAESSNLARSTLLHEYHHFLLSMSTDAVAYPRWYNEGMAEYWSSLTVKNGFAWFGHPVEGSSREYWLRGRSGQITFDTQELFSTTSLKLDSGSDESARFYARSRYAIHYFNSEPELRKQLAHYLKLYNLGFSQDQAVRMAFNKSYNELDQAMRRYVQRRPVARGFGIGKDGLDLPNVEMRVSKLDRAATYAVLTEVVPRFIRRNAEVSKQLIQTNLTLNPNDPDAHAAAIIYLAGDGSARLPQLLQRFPAHPRLLAMRAESLRQGAFARRATGRTGWEAQLIEARGLFRQAIHADPDNALAYYGLAQVYTALAHSEPVREGILAFNTALVFEPRAADFRALTTLLLRDKQIPQALGSMRAALAFGAGADRPLDALLMENLGLVWDLTSDPANRSSSATGLNFKSGSTYEGPLRDGRPEGKGKWLRPNGSIYEGEFAAGLPSGRGRLVSERGVAYEGDFADGFARGKGRITFPATSKLVSYEGAVEQAMPAGAGVLVTKDGRLQALFADGEAHGSGTFTPSAGSGPVSGNWLFGAFDWPEAEGVLFTGAINAKGQRHGGGWCRAPGAASPITGCFYVNDKNVAKGAPTEEE